MKYSKEFILSLKNVYRSSPFDKPVEFKTTLKHNFFPKEKLVRGEKAWTPRKCKTEDETTLKEVKSILNKISIDNFELLSQRMYEFNIVEVASLRELINLVFNKSVLEPKFGDVYANLCYKLSQKNYTIDNKVFNFRNEIINRCQKEFERHTSFQDDKLKVVGNVYFIGELYNKELLPKNVMFACMDKYFENIHTQKNVNDNIECICKLLTTTGKKLDIPNNEKILSVCFYNLKILSESKLIKPRYKFMIKDLLDLRKDKWVDRRCKKITLQRTPASY